MIKFEQISVENLTETDLFWLQRGCENAWDKATPADQIEGVKNGSAFFFRVTGDMEGVFVLSIGNKKERILMMTALAGTGMIRHFEEFYQKVRSLCQKAGAKQLCGFVARPGLQLLYRNKTTALPKAVLFVEDLT